MHAWDIFDRKSWMNVLPSTWSFHCKLYPDGIIKKLKARFFTRGDQQLEGVEYFEIYAPVVNWRTIRIMLIISILLDLQTVQVGFTAAFLHATIDKDPNWAKISEAERYKSGVYLEMPRGFRDEGKVLRLRKSLYGLKQAPRNFFLHLKGKLENIYFVQSDFDQCLFISDQVIFLVCIDDTLFFSPDQASISEVIEKLKLEGLELEMEIEDDVARFLGVHIDRKVDGTIHLTQTGFIDRIIKSLDLQPDQHPKQMPCKQGCLGADLDGERPHATYNYRSMVGQVGYLQSHSRPYIEFNALCSQTTLSNIMKSLKNILASI
jgi:hypothetical protein